VPGQASPITPRGVRRRHLSQGHRTALEQQPIVFPGADRSRWLLGDASVRRAVAGQVRDVLEDLSPKERAVMQLRFGLDGDAPLSVQQAALRLGVSRDRIRQLEAAARRKVPIEPRLAGRNELRGGASSGATALPPGAGPNDDRACYVLRTTWTEATYRSTANGLRSVR
jgi:hypothetical protein